MKLKLTGSNRMGREMTIELEVIKTKEETKTHPVVQWIDGRPAAFSGYKVWRATCNRFSVLFKEITEVKFIN